MTRRFWLVSVYADPDLRWSDTTFIVGAESAEAAAKAVVADKDFLTWWDDTDDRDMPAAVWVAPMREPYEDEVASVPPERKYQAQEFESLWDYELAVEVRLGDPKPAV